MTQEDDRRLLADCLEGKPGAWEAFVRRFAPYLASVCRRVMARFGLPAGPQEVDDMLQEIFLGLLRDGLHVLRAYRGTASVASYLATVAVHRVARERAPVVPARGGQTPPSESPADSLEVREAREILRAEIHRLPPHVQLALTLQSEGASLREIAQALGVTRDAVAHLLSRARTLLRERLKDAP